MSQGLRTDCHGLALHTLLEEYLVIMSAACTRCEWPYCNVRKYTGVSFSSTGTLSILKCLQLL